MAPPAKSPNPVNPPQTLPADFFDSQGGNAPATLPPDFFDKGGYPHYTGAPDKRNALQRVFDASTARDTSLDKGNPGWLNKASDLAPSLMRGFFAPVMHPVKTAEGLINTFAHPQQTAGTLVKSAEQNPVGTAGEFLGGAMSTAGLGGLPIAARDVAGNLNERFSGYTSPVIPTPLQNASKVAAAIHPGEGVGPHLESDIAEQMPFIKGFGQGSGNPMHSQWETGLAARGLAEQGLGHYNTRLLEPHANAPISMRTVPEYQGPVSGEGRMTTLGQLNKRLSDIHDLTRPVFRGAKTTGQELSGLEMKGLEAEEGKVSPILYQNLSNLTGVPEADIQALRQGYGRQFGIADAIDAARRQRLGQGGLSSEGGSVPLSTADAIGRFVNGVLRGPREYRANLNLRRAIEPFEPQQIKYPEPAPIEPAGNPIDRYLTKAREQQGLLRKEKK